VFEETGSRFLSPAGRGGEALPQVVVRDAESAGGPSSATWLPFRRDFSLSFIPSSCTSCRRTGTPHAADAGALPEEYHHTWG